MMLSDFSNDTFYFRIFHHVIEFVQDNLIILILALVLGLVFLAFMLRCLLKVGINKINKSFDFSLAYYEDFYK